MAYRFGLELGTAVTLEQADLPPQTIVLLRPGQMLVARSGCLETEWEHGYFVWGQLTLELSAGDALRIQADLEPGKSRVEVKLELDIEKVERTCPQLLQARNLEELLEAVDRRGFPAVLNLENYLVAGFRQASCRVKDLGPEKTGLHAISSFTAR